MSLVDLGSSSNWGVLTPDKDKRICSEYVGCVIPLLNAYSPSWISIFRSMILRLES